MNEIKIGNRQLLPSPGPASPASEKNDGFADRLKKAVKDVNQQQHTADDVIEKVVNGDLGVHEGMLTIGKADLSLRYMLQVRNKAMEAYREIMRMQF